MDLRIFSEFFGYVLFLCTVFIAITDERLIQVGTNDKDVYKDQSNTQTDELWDYKPNTSEERHKRSSTSGLVDIARFSDVSQPGKMHVIYVDDTMTRLVFQAAVKKSRPVMMVKMPGTTTPVHPVLRNTSSGTVVTTIATVDRNISAGEYGFWKFTKLDASTWDVRVKAESPVYIKQRLFENGTNTPITRPPVVGKEYRVEIEVVGVSHVQSVDTGTLFGKFKPTTFLNLTLKGGGTFEADNVTMPNETFVVGIQGMDNSGHLYKRIDPAEITPVTMLLDVSPYMDSTVFEHSLFKFRFTVTNLLPTVQDVDILLSDSRGYAQAPTSLSATLKVGENYTDMFVIKSDFAGLTTLVKITTRQHLGSGNFLAGPEELRNVTVITNQTTTTVVSTLSASTLATNYSSVTTSNTTQTVPSTSAGAVSNTTAVISSNVSSSGHFNTTVQTATGLPNNNQPPTGTPLSTKHGTVQLASGVAPSTSQRLVKGSAHISTATGGTSGSKSDISESDGSSTMIEISADAIVASMLTEIIVGIAAIVTMVVIFKKAMMKVNKRVAPVDEKREPNRSMTSDEDARSMTSEEDARSENAQFLYQT